MIAVSVVMFTGFAFLLGRKKRRRYLPFFVTAVICCACILLFSGDLADFHSVHGDGTPLSERLARIPAAMMDAVRLIVQYIRADWSRWLFTAGLCVWMGTGLPLRLNQKRGIVIWNAVMILTAVSALSVNTLLGYTPPRVLAVPLVWVGIALTGDGLLLGAVLSKGKSCFGWKITPLLLGLLVLLAVCQFTMAELPAVQSIRAAWEARDAVLSPVSGQGGSVETCALPVMGSGSLDLRADPNYEYNLVTAKYYGFDEIIAIGPCITEE